MNAVTVHCSSAIEVPNSLWIVGRATTTAAVGSCTIPAPATVAARVSGRLVLPLTRAESIAAATGFATRHAETSIA